MDRLEGTREGRREELVRSLSRYYEDEVGMNASEANDEARSVVRDASRLGGSVVLASRRWWGLALRGLLAILVGAVFLARPLEALTTLVMVIGAWVFVDGAITLVGGIAHREGTSSWLVAIEGLAGLVIGYLILTRPTGAAFVFFVLIAAWSMARGVAEIALGAGLRRGAAGKSGLIAVGIVSFLFGVFMLFAPLMGALALGYWAGLYALAYGVLLIVLSFQLRSVKKDVTSAIGRLTGGAQPAQPQPS